MSVQKFEYGRLDMPGEHYGMAACDDGNFVRVKDYVILEQRIEQQAAEIEKHEALVKAAKELVDNAKVVSASGLSYGFRVHEGYVYALITALEEQQ